LVVAALGALVVGGFAVAGFGDGGNRPVGARQAAVERRGMAVMPFDQARTTHVFTKTADGGVESVAANDPADTPRSS